MIIDKSLSTPLYQQVKDYLERKIVMGEWSLGYRLPTEKELATSFKVSNITIKRAIHELVNEGVLERYSGKGTFVVEKKGDKDISTLVSLKNDSWDENIHYPHKTIQFNKEEAGKQSAKVFNIEPQDQVYNITRVKMEDNKPAVLEYSFLPCSLFKEDLNPNDFEEDLIYNVLVKQYGMKLNKARIFFSTMVAGEDEQKLLEVSEGQKLFVIERYTISDDQHVVEYSKFVMEQNQTKFFLEIQI